MGDVLDKIKLCLKLILFLFLVVIFISAIVVMVLIERYSAIMLNEPVNFLDIFSTVIFGAILFFPLIGIVFKLLFLDRID